MRCELKPHWCKGSMVYINSFSSQAESFVSFLCMMRAEELSVAASKLGTILL